MRSGDCGERGWGGGFGQGHHKGIHRNNWPVNGLSQAMNKWLGNLHGTAMDSLHMCEGGMAWSTCGASGSGSGVCL